MQACKHEFLEFVGEQRTDDGVNTYRKCKTCGMLLVVTPSNTVVGIAGNQSNLGTPAGSS